MWPAAAPRAQSRCASVAGRCASGLHASMQVTCCASQVSGFYSDEQTMFRASKAVHVSPASPPRADSRSVRPGACEIECLHSRRRWRWTLTTAPRTPRSWCMGGRPDKSRSSPGCACVAFELQAGELIISSVSGCTRLGVHPALHACCQHCHLCVLQLTWSGSAACPSGWPPAAHHHRAKLGRAAAGEGGRVRLPVRAELAGQHQGERAALGGGAHQLRALVRLPHRLGAPQGRARGWPL